MKYFSCAVRSYYRLTNENAGYIWPAPGTEEVLGEVVVVLGHNLGTTEISGQRGVPELFVRPSEDMGSVSLDTLQVAQDLLLYLHDQDGGDPPDLGDLVLVDLVEDLVVQRQDVLQLVIRYPRLYNRKFVSPMKGW